MRRCIKIADCRRVTLADVAPRQPGVIRLRVEWQPASPARLTPDEWQRYDAVVAGLVDRAARRSGDVVPAVVMVP
ncbi:MAG: hypothetical protein JO007_21470 [Alphaproteobacteria bacterium]|nr:hypothetical protein [Alphaproteobacteria bacterium]